jgi:RNA polymerase sigma factor (sigma-70 family)
MSLPRLATTGLAHIFRGESAVGLTDLQLIERYRERRDEVAFESLVARHGPMVLAACRRMLVDERDVEDAFQATFLVLVRRARDLGPRDTVGPWLHGVATRVALRARCISARQRRLEPVGADFATLTDRPPHADWEIGELIDGELARLPAKYRSPVVLCYLEGHTHEEAARQLNWPVGTVKGRLSRARSLLASRLRRRGLAPSAGAIALAVTADTQAAVNKELAERTTRAAFRLALGDATHHVVSTSITALVEGVLTTMYVHSLKSAGAAVIACALVFGGIGVLARQEAVPAKVDARPALGESPTNKPAAEPKLENQRTASTTAEFKTDEISELREALYRAANRAWAEALKADLNTPSALEHAYNASKKLMDAARTRGSKPPEEVALARAHFDRVRELARLRHPLDSAADAEPAQLKAYAAEAALGLALAQASDKGKDSDVTKTKGVEHSPGHDTKSREIFDQLDKVVSMPFREETPLDDIIKYVRQATSVGSYPGIPIYVDPQGLEQASASLTSTIRNIELEGIPLRRTLQLILKQLDLAYFVEDGILCITSADREGTFGPAHAGPNPIAERLEKAERGELTLAEMTELTDFLKMQAQVAKLASQSGGDSSKAEAQKKDDEQTKADREQLSTITKELRELIEILKAEKAAKPSTLPK